MEKETVPDIDKIEYNSNMFENFSKRFKYYLMNTSSESFQLYCTIFRPIHQTRCQTPSEYTRKLCRELWAPYESGLLNNILRSQYLIQCMILFNTILFIEKKILFIALLFIVD